jgi:acyl transferase domain-containing protein
VANVILKPLQQALNDDDPIRAIIRNTCANQDGRTPGITMPSRDAQERLITTAYERAGLSLAHTGYVGYSHVTSTTDRSNGLTN